MGFLPFNPLTAKDELSRFLTFFIVLDPKEGVPRRATHAPLCNTLPSNNISPESVKILARLIVGKVTVSGVS